MQENKFEKQVQGKMDELKLHPTDAVWQKIEPQITKKKRRRWAIIILPVLLFSILLGGYKLWYSDTSFSVSQYQSQHTKPSPGKLSVNTNNSPATILQNPTKEIDQKQNKIITTVNKNENTINKYEKQKVSFSVAHFSKSSEELVSFASKEKKIRDTEDPELSKVSAIATNNNPPEKIMYQFNRM